MISRILKFDNRIILYPKFDILSYIFWTKFLTWHNCAIATTAAVYYKNGGFKAKARKINNAILK